MLLFCEVNENDIYWVRLNKLPTQSETCLKNVSVTAYGPKMVNNGHLGIKIFRVIGEVNEYIFSVRSLNIYASR